MTEINKLCLPNKLFMKIQESTISVIKPARINAISPNVGTPIYGTKTIMPLIDLNSYDE